MPYIGNTPAEKYAAFNVQHFTTSATTSYTLDRAVANELDIRLYINNVPQQPGAGKAYTAANTTLTLTSATAGTDTMYAVYIGKAIQTVAPGAGSVGTTALADSSVTEAKLNVSNSPVNGYVLSAQSGATGGLTWAADAGGAALTGSTNNTVTTVTGANAIQGEANLTFDGTNLDVATGNLSVTANGKVHNGEGEEVIFDNNGDTMQFKTGNSERLRITDQGALKITAGDGGTATNPTFNIHNTVSANPSYSNIKFTTAGNTTGCWIKGVQSSGGNDGDLKFYTNESGTNIEAMNIRYDGKIGIRCTPDGTRLKVQQVTNGEKVMQLRHGGDGDASGMQIQYYTVAPNNTSNSTLFFSAEDTAATRIKMFSNGNIQNTNNSYGALSDNRLKENITDANSQWNDIKKIKFKNFNLINETTTQLGVIAQDLEADGMSSLIDETEADKHQIAINAEFGTLEDDTDNPNEDGTFPKKIKENLEKVKGVKYSVLLLKSAKALQEAMEKIENLETKVTALENV